MQAKLLTDHSIKVYELTFSTGKVCEYRVDWYADLPQPNESFYPPLNEVEKEEFETYVDNQGLA